MAVDKYIKENISIDEINHNIITAPCEVRRKDLMNDVSSFNKPEFNTFIIQKWAKIIENKVNHM